MNRLHSAGRGSTRRRPTGDGRWHVLLVDDEPTNLELLGHALAADYRLSVAQTAAQTLAMAGGEDPPDIILLDVMLGDDDGFDVCTRLKSNPATAWIQVVFVSALGDSANERRGLELGAVDYIHKPIAPALVRARVAAHVEVLRHRQFFDELLERHSKDLRSAEDEVRELLSAVRASEARFRAYAEASSDWFWETDADGRVVYLSDPAASALLVAEDGRLRLVPPTDARARDLARHSARWRDLWQRFDARQPFRNFEFEVGAGTPRHVRVSGVPRFDATGAFSGYHGAGSDVTDTLASQRQAAALRDAIDSASDGVVLMDADGHVMFTNDEFHRCFPEAPTKRDVVGRPVCEVLDTAGDVSAAGEDTFPTDSDGGDLARECTLPDGKVYLVRERRTDDGGTLALYTDITESKSRERRLRQQRRALRRMTSELSLTEERERRRIAAQLHDGPVQTFGLARMRLGQLRVRARGSDYAGAIEQVVEPFDEAIRGVRHVMAEVSPPVLYELGLTAAIEWLATRSSERDSLPVELAVTGEALPLDDDRKVLLFQATRELLSNVARHARASRAALALRWLDAAVEIEVADDGVGFDADTIRSRPADSQVFGLLSIRERLRPIAGELSIASRTGDTRVALRLPLDQEAGA